MAHLFLFPGIERIAVVPLVGKLDEGAGRGRRLQDLERVEQDPGLSPLVKWLAGLVAEGEVHKNGTGRFDRSGDIEGSREHDGRNTSLLDGTGEQSHGLVAQLSDRNQEGHIDLECLQTSDKMRRHLLLEPGPREDAAHEGEGR